MSWREDVSLLNNIGVWDVTGMLIVYQHSHCHISVGALQDGDTLGTCHLFQDDPQCKVCTESNALVNKTVDL